MENWGIETTIDLIGCDKKIITSHEKLLQYAEKLVKVIDMIPYLNPIVMHFGQDEKIKGYTLVQFIQTSLISGHFVDETGEAYINIFSCKDYDSILATEFTKNYFEAATYECSRNIRGRRNVPA